jgi:D-alanine-D-alanine ligase
MQYDLTGILCIRYTGENHPHTGEECMMTRTILVLFGGVSPEYAVSLRSAYNIIQGLRTAGFNVVPVGITQSGEWLRHEGSDQAIVDDQWEALAQNRKSRNLAQVFSPRSFIQSIAGCDPDCIFPAVHGVNCEDGALQGLLTLSGFPYVGSGVLASAACMDKVHARKIFRDAGIPQCAFTAATRSEIETEPQRIVQRVIQTVGFPCFLKPSNGGSSIGTCRVSDPETLGRALRTVSRYDRVVLIESFVKAREIEVSVLGNDQPDIGHIGEVKTNDSVDYYDYETKYLSDDGAQVIVPARLDELEKKMICDYAIRAYTSMGCAGLARVDFFIEQETHSILLNEINTLPGFTPISIYPKAFNSAGVSLPELVTRLCDLAIEAHAMTKRAESL